ncbi:MAG TPA: hypothetical protein VGW10_12910 [Solirubrobacteraceae bacterium]|nr:hypothetical protein [Solirubrobacteraceae bacterium]
MIQTGHGRPRRALPLAALVLLTAFLAGAATAPAASRYGNVVEVVVPRPAANQVVLARVQVEMGLRRGFQGARGRLNVRRAGGRLPRGYSVTAVRARPRGSTVTIRLAAVRSSSPARAGRSLRVPLRIGHSGLAFRRARVWTVPIGPATAVRRTRDCTTIAGEAARWSPVGGLARLSIGGERYSAQTTVGAAQQIACEKRIRSVSANAAARFLTAVDPDFADGAGGGTVEGFYATWARDAAGAARVCVYVRGARGGTGDVTVASTSQQYTLDDDTGIARLVTAVAGEGEYAFTVRWRQRDGTYRESVSTLRVPPSGQKGNDPPAPYSVAGPCG